MSDLVHLKTLASHSLWYWFNWLCAIPHPTFHEEELIAKIKEFAAERNLDLKQDATGNLLVTKPATPGYEDKATICIQSHLDMVPQADKEFDFKTQPIVPHIVGEHVYADNTTLGADNGIGVAACLALLADNDYEHGKLEVLFTLDEEVGMGGAEGLDPNLVTAQYLINTDTEEWGKLYLGCAGGIDLNISKEFNWKTIKPNSSFYTFGFKGFRGGHSGIDINTDRLSAIQQLNKLLVKLYENVKFNPCYYYSGQARNAISREATVGVAVTAENKAKFEQELAKIKVLAAQAIPSEVGGYFFVDTETTYPSRLSCADVPNLLGFFDKVPNGLLKNSDEFAGVVETSCSAGIVRLGEQYNGFKYKILVRSIINEEIDKLAEDISAIARSFDLDVVLDRKYSGWRPENNEFTAYITEVYENLVQKPVEVEVVHAGLECGIFKKSYPDLKIVSIGPNIYNPHTPKEHCEIKSCEDFYTLCKKILSDNRLG